MPSEVSLYQRGEREYDRNQDARDIADSDKHDDGNQVDERWNGLHRVQERPKYSFETIALAC